MHSQGSQRRAVVQRQGWLEWTTNLAFYPLRFIVSAANELFQVIGMSFQALTVDSL